MENSLICFCKAHSIKLVSEVHGAFTAGKTYSWELLKTVKPSLSVIFSIWQTQTVPPRGEEQNVQENAQHTPPSSGTRITWLPPIHLQVQRMVASIQHTHSFFPTDSKKKTQKPTAPFLLPSPLSARRSMGFPSTDGYSSPRLLSYGMLSSAFPTLCNYAHSY